MTRRVNILALVMTMTLIISGVLALLLSPINTSTSIFQAQDASPSSSSNIVGLELGIVSLSTCSGTMAFLHDTLITPLHTTIVVALGTIVADGRSDLKNKKLRDRIIEQIDQNPGIHLRELHRVLGCAMGALQYHLTNLLDERLVISFQSGNTRHFFPFGFTEDNDVLQLVSLIRNPTIRSIISESMKHDRITQAELSRKLSLEKSLISYYANNLVNVGILKTIKVFGRERPLALVDWAKDAIKGMKLL